MGYCYTLSMMVPTNFVRLLLLLSYRIIFVRGDKGDHFNKCLLLNQHGLIGQAFKKYVKYLFLYVSHFVLRKCSNKPNLG